MSLAIQAIDNFLPPAEYQVIWTFLNEGGLHLDSNIPSHMTAIYYLHPAWDADLAGETCSTTRRATRCWWRSIRSRTGW